MTVPKTYDGKFHRVKHLIENSPRVVSAVQAFADANPAEWQSFYDAKNEMKTAIFNTLREQGMDKYRQPTKGKAPKSAEYMARTLTRWLEGELFPEKRDPLDQPIELMRRVMDGEGEDYLIKNHRSTELEPRSIREKLGLANRQVQPA